MIKFREFSFREEIEVHGRGTFGPTLYREKKYQDTHRLYGAVAKFASECGDRLVAITGSPWGGTTNGYMCGDVVVWYREETRATTEGSRP